MSNDFIIGLACDGRKNRFSTLYKLKDEDVVNVWDHVAYFIERNMASQKGVALPGLGVFTFTQKKLDVGNKQTILIQRPVFVVSEKFTMTHGLESTKYHTNGQIPVIQLNFSVLSKETQLDRDTVEGCIKEILLSLSRHIQSKRPAEFPFCRIGKLLVKDLKVKMKFFKDFLQSMDGSGYLLNAMTNRPDTAGSVISRIGTPFSRPGTSQSIPLPRITPGIDYADDASNEYSVSSAKLQRMPAISEEENVENSENVSSDNQENPSSNPDSVTSRPSRLKTAPSVLTSERSSSTANTNSSQQSKRTNQPATAERKITPNFPRGIKGSSISPGARNSSSCGTDERDCQSSTSIEAIDVEESVPSSRITPLRPANPSLRQATLDNIAVAPKTAEGLAAIRATVSKVKPRSPPRTAQPRIRAFDPSCSGCIHSSGQDLCYLCHQRDRRNIPIYTAADRRRKEQDEDRLLQHYQNVQDSAAILGEQAKKLVNRQENQKIAAFNLGISEAIKSKNTERPTDFHRSYVFQKRPITPPHYIQQERYAGSLANQVEEKVGRLHKDNMEKDFLERLEQVQLAEDLATQRRQYLLNKKIQNEEYRKALDTQIYIRKYLESQNSCARDVGMSTKAFSLPKPNIILPFQHAQVMRVKEPGCRMTHFKPLPIPAAEPDSDGPIFGVHDDTNEKALRNRQRAHSLYQDQLNMVAEKKKRAILHDIKTQKEESEMLQRTRKELLEDMLDRHSMELRQRNELEKNWTEAVKRKREKETDEKRRAQSPGVLIHEQCDKYRRCRQCKRQMANCGESNVWSESRYVPGSMLMA